MRTKHFDHNWNTMKSRKYEYGQGVYMKNSNDSQGKGVPGDFVGPGSFHTSTSAYDYMVTSAVTIESPVTCAVNIERLEADKWIVVRGKKNGSKTSYLLEPD
jgi:hypothetical protein